MKKTLSGLAVLGVLFSQPAVAETEERFCADLRSSNLVNWMTGTGALYYRNSKREIVDAESFALISRKAVSSLVYYVRNDTPLNNQSGLLNVKSVYRSSKAPQRRKIVYVHNDRWERLPPNRRDQAWNDCSGVTLQGYEQFHAGEARNFCLSYRFHQRDEFDTLGTSQRRASFAFGNMVDPEPGLFSSFFDSFGPRRAGAAEAEMRQSHVRSWIRNFNHGPNSDRCIFIKPEFPEDVDSVMLRITYHGTPRSPAILERTWRLTFDK